MTVPRIKLGKAIEVVIFIAALGVLAENIVLLRENRRLRETAAWQIPAGKQLRCAILPIETRREAEILEVRSLR